MEPLKAPKRAPVESRKADASAIWWVVALGLCMVGGIAWQHLFPGQQRALDGSIIEGQADGMDGGTAGGGFASAGMGARKEMQEAPLEKAKALPKETFAGAVSHVQDSEACASLRTARARVQSEMSKSHSEGQAKEFQLDLKSIRNRGTELGCWSGGAG